MCSERQRAKYCVGGGRARVACSTENARLDWRLISFAYRVVAVFFSHFARLIIITIIGLVKRRPINLHGRVDQRTQVMRPRGCSSGWCSAFNTIRLSLIALPFDCDSTIWRQFNRAATIWQHTTKIDWPF